MDWNYMGIKLVGSKKIGHEIKITNCESGVSFKNQVTMPLFNFKKETKGKTNGSDINFFYKRTELEDEDKNQEYNRDGNPLLYALKRKNEKEYRIDEKNKEDFFNKIKNSKNHYKSFFKCFDAIILIPTSNKILSEMVNILNETYKIPVYNDILLKKKNKEIDINSIKSTQRKRIESYPNSYFEIKKIPKLYRHKINHLEINKLKINDPKLKGMKFLLIDDSITTGSSFRVGDEELKTNNIEDCSLFSFFGSRTNIKQAKKPKDKRKREIMYKDKGKNKKK